ncbi:MAG: DNA polymerase III subunit gamma/tau [Candidatus Hydrogenedentes bacterium]|nr:DNA polymerase III subunit gamma/tau [Candidatus Hydrogenedentota bacterium]
MADDQYLVLARKWRPQAFDNVVGQDHITRTLKNAITSGRIHHAFLFIGSRGIGKTTTARILAKALNCLEADGPTPTPCGVCSNCAAIAAGNAIDVIEIDGASNNSVEDVRELRDNIRMVPTNARYKVYIIDEVHQLSIAAFNALLKTLEEPPPHAIFILATTEAHKIPATIISRCQRYDFRRVPVPQLITLLRKILDKEGLAATDEALHAIARAAEGGVRDSESILDELITYCDGEITFKDVFDVLGLVDWQLMHDICDAILAKDVTRQLVLVEEVVTAGKDLTQFVEELLRYFRNLLVCRTANARVLIHLPEEELDALSKRAEKISLTNLIRLVEQFSELVNNFDSQLAQRIALESMLIRISKVGVEVSLDTIMDKLVALGQGGLGAATDQPTPAASTTAATPPEAPPKPESPPDPPVAGPAKPAPAAPASKAPIQVTPENMIRAWDAIIERSSHDDLNLLTWFKLGKPTGIDGETLRLSFSSANKRALDFVQDRGNQKAMGEALSRHTTNLTSIAITVQEDTSAKEAPSSAGKGSDLPVSPGINAEEAKEALKDPSVATIVDVFKGRIVDIKSVTSGEGES